MSKLLVLANEATAAQRRVYFHLVDATDGITPETGEAGGQPQVSSDGGAWTNTGIGTLSAIGNGRYYADLTQTLVQTAGTQIETRYKSANTAECPGDSVQVVAFDPNSATDLGLSTIAAILDDTDLIDDGTSGLAKIATDVAAILVDTGTTLQGELDGIQADTEDIQSRLPAALVSGRIDASVGAMAANVMTAAAAAADLATELQNGLATAAALATVQTSVDDLPTNAELATALAAADDAVLAAIAALNNLSQANIRTAVGLASANLDTQLDALPTNAELSTALAAADDAVLAAIAALNNLGLADIRTAVGLASANLDTQLDALPTNAELSTALAAADDAVLAAIAALNNLSIANVRTAVGLASANLDTQLNALPTNAELATAITTALTTALTEGYRSTGATGSVRDLLYEILANITEFSISGTTKTAKKLDGSTTAKTYTLDSATTPTSITEAT